MTKDVVAVLAPSFTLPSFVICFSFSFLLSAELLFPLFFVFSMFTDQVITSTFKQVLDMNKKDIIFLIN